MADTIDTFSTSRPVPVRRPLNLRSYREPDQRVASPLRNRKTMLLVAAPVGVAAGLLAWRFKRFRPVLTSLALSAFAWSTNAWRRSLTERAHDSRIDEAIDESFPASDPPAMGH